MPGWRCFTTYLALRRGQGRYQIVSNHARPPAQEGGKLLTYLYNQPTDGFNGQSASYCQALDLRIEVIELRRKDRRGWIFSVRGPLVVGTGPRRFFTM